MTPSDERDAMALPDHRNFVKINRNNYWNTNSRLQDLIVLLSHHPHRRDSPSMRKTKSLSITLPHNMAQMVKRKVASGAYATESEVIREGLRALDAQDQALERWLAAEGVARYDAYHRAGRAGQPASKVFDELRAHRAKRVEKSR